MTIFLSCPQCGRDYQARPIVLLRCARCGNQLDIPIKSKVGPISAEPKKSFPHSAPLFPFQRSTGQAVWFAIVLVLLIGIGVVWFLNRKGLLGGDEAEHASSANASLMHLRKAMWLADAGRPGEAEAEFARSITLTTAPGSESWRAVSDEQAALLMRGEARLTRGEPRDAEEDFSKVISLTGTPPNSEGLSIIESNNYKFLAFLDRALTRSQRNDLNGARNDLTSALAAIPDYSHQRIQWLMAQIDSPGKSSGSWLEYLEQQGKKDGYYYLVRGQHKMWRRDYSAAILDFTKSIERNDEAALSLQHRGVCKLFLGDQSGAQADFKQADELMQNPGMIYFFRAVLRQIDADYRGAIADYAEVIRLDPKPLKGPPGRRSAISTIYVYHNDWFVAAVSKMPQLGDVVPKVESAHFNMALCYEQLGLIREAKEELHQALQKQGNLVKVEDRLARLNDNATKHHP